MNSYFVSSYSTRGSNQSRFPDEKIQFSRFLGKHLLIEWYYSSDLKNVRVQKKSLCFCFINIKFLMNVSQIYSCFWKEDRLNMEFYCSYIMSVSLKLAKFGHAPWKPHLKENLPLKNSSVWDVFRTLSNIYGWGFTQAAKQSCSVKKVFLEIS